MDNFHGGKEGPEKIKLFGATIAVEVRQVKDEAEKSNQAAEKRSEKIIPCPRCKSLETKFCYFNNYNVNQPRHFCKGCQRYWTAGGALRNVPVGAGRRKAKPTGQGLAGFAENGFFVDAYGMDRFELEGMVEEWQVVARGGYRQGFPAKKPRESPGGQTC